GSRPATRGRPTRTRSAARAATRSKSPTRGGRAPVRTCALALLLCGACVASVPLYKGPVTDHFDGARFHNQRPEVNDGPAALFKWLTHSNPGSWSDYTEYPPGPPPPRRPEPGQLRATFL